MIKSLINKALIVLILLVSHYTIVLGQQQKQSTSRLAYEYYNDQDWEKASALFLQMYQENGVKAYLNNYIRCLVQMKDFKTAEQTLTKIIRKTKDQSLYIDLAYLSEIQGNEKKSNEQYLQPMKDFPQTVQSIKTLGNNYLYYLKYEYAQQVYEIGRQLLNQPNEFHLEMASIFLMQRNYAAMLDEYFELLIYQPRYLRTVQAQVRSAMTRDVDEILLESTKTKTLAQIQTYPGLDVFNEMLIWVYLQEEDFDSAIELAAALDRRNKENGEKLLELARTADNAKAYKSAIKAYDIIIAKGPPSENNKTSRNVSTVQSPFRLAKQEILTAELLLLESQNDSQPADYLSLLKKYEKTINEVGLDHLNVILLKELSYVNAYRLHNLDRAVNILDSALQTPRIQKDLRAEMILDKADILLLQNDPWEATFLYAQVEKENTQNPIGSLAKYKKAMLAYFTGNFDWAKMQLDVLKGSTSKLIANDAFELSLSIRENQNNDDSLNNGLLSLSRADYLYFQKKTDSALQVLNSLIEDSPNPTITDDALFKQAEIFLDTNREEKAIKSLEKIYSDFLYGIWGHKALYLLGKIYEERKDYDKAMNYYQQLLDKFPNSFYHIDARNKIREIEDKAKSIDPNT